MLIELVCYLLHCVQMHSHCSHVELSYQWMLYHPLTELGDAGRVSSRVVLLPEDSAFTVEQQRGILPPQKETTVRFCFNPSQVHVHKAWDYIILVLYCVGNIKSTACVTNLVVTQKIIIAWGSRLYTYNHLPLPICDRLALHLAVATVCW